MNQVVSGAIAEALVRDVLHLPIHEGDTENGLLDGATFEIKSCRESYANGRTGQITWLPGQLYLLKHRKGVLYLVVRSEGLSRIWILPAAWIPDQVQHTWTKLTKGMRCDRMVVE